MISPKIIFFDAAGTLLHLPMGVGWHYRDVALRHGLELDKARTEKAFRTAFHTLPHPPVTRSARPDDDEGWWRTLVWQVLEDAGAPENFAREAYFEELYEAFTLPGVWQLFPEVREVLAFLAPKYRLGIISNFDGRLRSVLRHEGIDSLFDVWSISSEVGSDKPDPWIFKTALHRAGVEAGEALHVGDDPEGDWAAAAAAGLQVFKLRRPENSLSDLAGLL